MKRTLWPALVALAVLTCAGSGATATSRIKDLANIEGIRQNQLIGTALWSASTVPAAMWRP
jgi:flagellar P-ring protein FlgI